MEKIDFTNDIHINNCYILSFNSIICVESWEPSFKSNPAATTGVFIPQARPKLALLEIKQ